MARPKMRVVRAHKFGQPVSNVADAKTKLEECAAHDVPGVRYSIVYDGENDYSYQIWRHHVIESGCEMWIECQLAMEKAMQKDSKDAGARYRVEFDVEPRKESGGEPRKGRIVDLTDDVYASLESLVDNFSCVNYDEMDEPIVYGTYSGEACTIELSCPLHDALQLVGAALNANNAACAVLGELA